MSAFNQRLQPLRELMKAKGLDAFVLRRNPNLAWAIAGRAHVPTTIDMACFDLIITQDSATAITNVVEAPRLIAEELSSEVSVKTIKWSEGRDPLLPTGPKVGSDQPGGDRIDLGVEVEIIRASLIESSEKRAWTEQCPRHKIILAFLICESVRPPRGFQGFHTTQSSRVKPICKTAVLRPRC